MFSVDSLDADVAGAGDGGHQAAGAVGSIENGPRLQVPGPGFSLKLKLGGIIAHL